MTIKDLAARTGYSVGTVSRVLNHQPHVSEAAKAAILQAADECGFQLNTNAKQLKQQHSNSILAICKGTGNELFDNMLVAIQARIGATEYALTVDYLDEGENEIQRAIRLCAEKKPRGILFLGGDSGNFLKDFDKITIPCVLVTNSAARLPYRNLSSVSSDDALAAEMAIDHLASLGHRNIGIIGGWRDKSDITALRYSGCMRSFERHGIQFAESRYETTRFSYDDGYRAARALLLRQPELTAIFAMSDVMAIGALRALRDLGREVPEEISVVGFDGLALCDYTVPRLTTVAQSARDLVDRSLALLAHYGEKDAAAVHETVPVTLLVKESTKEM